MRLFGNDTGRAEKKTREEPDPFPRPLSWLRASLGWGPVLGTEQWGLERKEVKAEASALKVSHAVLQLRTLGDPVTGADRPGPGCPSGSPPGLARAPEGGWDHCWEPPTKSLLGNLRAAPPRLGDNVPFIPSSPGPRAGREGGSPSPSGVVLASPGDRDSPSLARCWGQGKESKRGKRLGGLGHLVGTGPQPLPTCEVEGATAVPGLGAEGGGRAGSEPLEERGLEGGGVKWALAISRCTAGDLGPLCWPSIT